MFRNHLKTDDRVVVDVREQHDSVLTCVFKVDLASETEVFFFFFIVVEEY